MCGFRGLDVCVLRLKTIFNLGFYLTSFGKFCIQGQNCNFYNPFSLKKKIMYFIEEEKHPTQGVYQTIKVKNVNYNNQ